MYLTKINAVLQLHSCGNLRFLVISQFFLLLRICFYLIICFVYVYHTTGCTNTSHHVAVATKFCVNWSSA